MPSIATGFAGALRVSTEWVIDPQMGDSIQETWEGLKFPILSLAVAFKKIGGRARVTHAGPKYRLVVTLGQTPAAGVETPVDRYSFDSELAYISIFNLPKATDEASKYISPARYRKDIQDAVAKGDQVPLGVVQEGFPYSLVLYRML